MESTLQSTLAVLPAELQGRKKQLQRLDVTDISLSSRALAVIRFNVLSFFGTYAPEAVSKDPSPAKSLALLLDRLYFDQETGELIMCADLGQHNLCLPIPQKHWSFNRPYLVQ
ncbi:MAG: hypothetical protein ACNI3A_19585 [Desulfovibrio sp.]|uniref:hypothetical protein n=1 Tax=Desulfovibrio sp. 7SRBS1 TaxID=3378064 RepID=UPI003B3E4E35